MSKIEEKVQRTIFPYVLFHDIAHYELQAARNTGEGRFDNCLKAMVFSAFSLEAYIYHIGIQVVSNWEKTEKYKDPKSKLLELTEVKMYSPDFSSRPFATFDLIFDFRKQIVHGKTEHLRQDEIKEGEVGENIPEMLLASWEKLITLDIAVSFVEDSQSMIKTLHPIFGYQADPFFTQWKSTWEVKPAK